MRERYAVTAGPGEDVVAAAIAAVEMFLDFEQQELTAPKRGMSAWRLAIAHRPSGHGRGLGMSWRGLD